MLTHEGELAIRLNTQGKSFASLMHHLKHIHDPNYRGITIRRTTPMLLKPGAIWDEAKAL